jgi:GDP/UDP-N,N'-diacetylbacillosamine 2-epimerase (hydrolysing)
MPPLRVLVVTGTRADLGLWRPVLAEALRRPEQIEPRLLVTAMHLDQRFGHTVDEARALGVPIAAEVPCTPRGDGRDEMAAALGVALERMAPVVAAERPDWLLVLGDRGEQLAAALAAVHVGTAIAHLHGGERTLGSVDDVVRDMISRAAHLHFVATEAAAARLERLGEAPWRIHRTGAPGLDALAAEAAGDAGALRTRYGLPPEGNYLLVLQHSETVGDRDAGDDLAITLAAVADSGLAALAIGPNADAGGRAMAELLERTAGSRLATAASLSRDDYATLMRHATALIGNSSSGLIEAPLLRVPAVNVGDRQAGRTRGDNVVDVPVDAAAIRAAIARVRDPAFRAGLSGTSPYGDGHAAPRIVDTLMSQPVDRRLLVKAVGVPVE